MPKIICAIPNAATEIVAGEALVKFEWVDGALVSQEVDADTADYLSSIPGYSLADAAVSAEALATDELLVRAAAVGLTAHPRWKLSRLKTEVEAAEAAKAAPVDAPTQAPADAAASST